MMSKVSNEIDYFVYRIYRIDCGYKWIIYVGGTKEESITTRFNRHCNNVGAVYKRNCPGGKRGEVRSPDTPYGREASNALYQFIRKHCGGIEGKGVLWDIEEEENTEDFTEDEWMDYYSSQGHIIFNCKKGEGKYWVVRTKADLSDASSVKDSVKIVKKFDAEQHKLDQERRAEQLRAKKQRLKEESDRLTEWADTQLRMVDHKKEAIKRREIEEESKRAHNRRKAADRRAIETARREQMLKEQSWRESIVDEVVAEVIEEFKYKGKYYLMSTVEPISRSELVNGLRSMLMDRPLSSWVGFVDNLIESAQDNRVCIDEEEIRMGSVKNMREISRRYNT